MMNLECFIASQRRAVNIIFGLFVSLLATMWIVTLCDHVFNLGWGWDKQILWLAPPMMLFAVIVRFCCALMFRFVSCFLNDR